MRLLNKNIWLMLITINSVILLSPYNQELYKDRSVDTKNEVINHVSQKESLVPIKITTEEIHEAPLSPAATRWLKTNIDITNGEVIFEEESSLDKSLYSIQHYIGQEDLITLDDKNEIDKLIILLPELVARQEVMPIEATMAHFLLLSKRNESEAMPILLVNLAKSISAYSNYRPTNNINANHDLSQRLLNLAEVPEITEVTNSEQMSMAAQSNVCVLSWCEEW